MGTGSGSTWKGSGGAGVAPPSAWKRAGLVLEAGADGVGAQVLGDPCIVRDDDAGLWRMFLFALPPGHAEATCAGDPADPGAWTLRGPVAFTNPQVLQGRWVFKPFVVLDPSSPGRAATIDGLYALLLVTDQENKVVRRAWSESLAGPWTVETGAPLIGSGDFFAPDGKHVDAVSAYFFPERGEILYFYMGYPLAGQEHPTSPFGSAQCAAVEPVDSAINRGRATLAGRTPPASRARRLGPVLPPSDKPGHWAGGWVGGLQLLPGRKSRWIALVNASPTPPDEHDESLWREEPPPSLAGFAFCDEEFPVSGWTWSEAPLETLEDVPEEAQATGETTNLWRHHALVLPNGRLALFYNAGPYFEEKLFLKVSG